MEEFSQFQSWVPVLKNNLNSGGDLKHGKDKERWLSMVIKELKFLTILKIVLRKREIVVGSYHLSLVYFVHSIGYSYLAQINCPLILHLDRCYCFQVDCGK